MSMTVTPGAVVPLPQPLLVTPPTELRPNPFISPLALRYNPLRPSDADGPTTTTDAPSADSGARHVRFSGSPPKLAELDFAPTPQRGSKKKKKRDHSQGGEIREGGSEPDTKPENPEPDAAVAPEGTASPDAKDDGAPQEKNEDAAKPQQQDQLLDSTSSDDDDDEVYLDITERLYNDAKRVARRRERARRRAAEAYELIAKSEATFKPVISKNAQEIKYGSWKKFLAHTEERKERAAKIFAKKKEKIETEALEQCTEEFRAKPLGLSQSLVEQMKAEGRYDGPVKRWSKHFARFLIKRSGSPPPGPAPQEQLRRRSPLRHGTPPVFERLHNEASTRRVAHNIVVAAQLDSEASELFHPVTNHRVARMHSSASIGREASASSQVVAPQQLSLRLMGRGKAPGTVAELDAMDPADAIYGFSPDLSAAARVPPPYHTDPIVDEIEGQLRLGETELLSGDVSPARRPTEVVEALLEKGREYHERAAQRKRQIEDVAYQECTFKPVTNPHSHRMLQSIAHEASRDAEGFASSRRYSRRNGEDVVEAVALDKEFAAAVAGHGSTMLRHRRSGGKAAADRGNKPRFNVNLFTSRSDRFLSEKADRIEQWRALKAAQEMSECRFRPLLSPGTAVRKSTVTSLTPKPATVSSHGGSNTSTPRRIDAVTHGVSTTPRSLTLHASTVVHRSAERSVLDSSTTPRVTALRQPAETRNESNSISPAAKDDSLTPAAVDTVLPLDDGMAYLEALETELRGVLDEWRRDTD